MNNWKKYALGAMLVTAAGFAYVNNSHRNIPTDLRDAVIDGAALDSRFAATEKDNGTVPVPKTPVPAQTGASGKGVEDEEGASMFTKSTKQEIVNSFLGSYSLVKDGSEEYDQAHPQSRGGGHCEPELLISEWYDGPNLTHGSPVVSCDNPPLEYPKYKRDGIILYGLSQKALLKDHVEFTMEKVPQWDREGAEHIKNPCRVVTKDDSRHPTSFGYLMNQVDWRSDITYMPLNNDVVFLGGFGIGIPTQGRRNSYEISPDKIVSRSKPW